MLNPFLIFLCYVSTIDGHLEMSRAIRVRQGKSVATGQFNLIFNEMHICTNVGAENSLPFESLCSNLPFKYYQCNVKNPFLTVH